MFERRKPHQKMRKSRKPSAAKVEVRAASGGIVV